MIDLHPAQREAALVRIGFCKAGGRPLRMVHGFCVGQVKLTGAGRQVGAEGSGAVARDANLPGSGRRNIPGVPSRGKNVLTAKQNAADGVIGPANLVIEGRTAGAGFDSCVWVNAAAVRSLKRDAIWVLWRVKNGRVVGQGGNPTITIVMEIGVDVGRIDVRSFFQLVIGASRKPPATTIVTVFANVDGFEITCRRCPGKC